jgi:hypothetical protein
MEREEEGGEGNSAFPAGTSAASAAPKGKSEERAAPLVALPREAIVYTLEGASDAAANGAKLDFSMFVIRPHHSHSHNHTPKPTHQSPFRMISLR